MRKVQKLLIVITAILMTEISIVRSTAEAGMIEIQTALTLQQRSLMLEESQRYLLEEDVSQALVDLGVDKASVISRLSEPMMDY